jgi:hypothetical protein
MNSQKNQNLFIYALRHYYGNDYTYVEVGNGDELILSPEDWCKKQNKRPRVTII